MKNVNQMSSEVKVKHFVGIANLSILTYLTVTYSQNPFVVIVQWQEIKTTIRRVDNLSRWARKLIISVFNILYKGVSLACYHIVPDIWSVIIKETIEIIVEWGYNGSIHMTNKLHYTQLYVHCLLFFFVGNIIKQTPHVYLHPTLLRSTRKPQLGYMQNSATNA